MQKRPFFNGLPYQANFRHSCPCKKDKLACTGTATLWGF
jgi:hypothetical protein